MEVRKEDLGKCGIYCIKNLITNKVYIGKSINIYKRIYSHINEIKRKSKNENRHLINSWFKYGENNFEYFVLEYLELDENLLKERELYWMQQYNSTNALYGYNLRMDSSTKMIVHQETKEKLSKSVSGKNNPNYNHKWSEEKKKQMSELKKQQYKDGVVSVNIEAIRKGISRRNKNFIDNPKLKENMILKVREKNTKYKIYQYDKNSMELIKVWDYISDIIKENPNYKKHNIYAVCSGEKKSMYGYVWKKVLKDDIVQTNMKVLE